MSKLVIVLFCIVGLVPARSEPVGCTTSQPGTTCLSSDSCGLAVQDGDEYKQQCDVTEDYYSLPEDLSQLEDACYDFENGLYTNCGEVDDENSTKDEGMPTVVSKIETVNFKRFNMTVSWIHNVSSTFRKGYQVQVIFDDSDDDPPSETIHCFCVNDPEATRLRILGSLSLNFEQTRAYDMLTVKVAPYPLPKTNALHRYITGKSCINCTSPKSCNDVGPNNCYPRRYPPPENVAFSSSIYNITENNQTMRLDIEFDHARPQPGYNNPPENFAYFITLIPEDQDYYAPAHFRVNSSSNSSRLSVSLLPLDPIINYTSVCILTYYPCAGVAEGIIDRAGCGNGIGDCYKIPPVLTTTPSPSTTNTFVPTATPTRTSIPTVTESVPYRHMTIVLATLVPALVLLLVITILTVIIITTQRRKKALLTTHSPVLFPMPGPQQRYQVLVLYSPRSKEETAILEHVVQGLRQAGLHQRVFIEVSYPDSFPRESASQVVEQEVKKADAVFIVCTETFKEEWINTRHSPYVNVTKHMIYSKISTGSKDLKKFAVVTLNKEEHIPSDYLKSWKKFNVGEEGPDDTQHMVNFVTKQPQYQLAPLTPKHSYFCSVSPLHISDVTMEFGVSENPTSSDTASSKSSEDTSSASLLHEDDLQAPTVSCHTTC